MLTVALLGYDGGEIARNGLADHCIVVDCADIPRIQETQAAIYHVLRGALAAMLELFTTARLSVLRRGREQLEWDGAEYVEYDVEADGAARARLLGLAGAGTMVPVLVEDGQVIQVGFHGRGCAVGLRL